MSGFQRFSNEEPITIAQAINVDAEVAWDRDVPGDYPWFKNHDPTKDTREDGYCYKECSGKTIWISISRSTYPWDHLAMVTDGHGLAWLWDGEKWREWVAS